MKSSCGSPLRGDKPENRHRRFHDAREVPAGGIDRKGDGNTGMGDNDDRRPSAREKREYAENQGR